MRVALCPGSFDPITNGHVDIIERAAKIFDTVLVTIFENSVKSQPLLTVEQRERLCRQALDHLDDVRVETAEGLLVDYAEENNVAVIIKGLRAVSDFEYEFQMAQMNKQLAEKIETFFMMTRPHHSYLSSSIVKEIARFGGEIDELVPAGVAETLRKEFSAE